MTLPPETNHIDEDSVSLIRIENQKIEYYE